MRSYSRIRFGILPNMGVAFLVFLFFSLAQAQNNYRVLTYVASSTYSNSVPTCASVSGLAFNCVLHNSLNPNVFCASIGQGGRNCTDSIPRTGYVAAQSSFTYIVNRTVVNSSGENSYDSSRVVLGQISNYHQTPGWSFGSNGCGWEVEATLTCIWNPVIDCGNSSLANSVWCGLPSCSRPVPVAAETCKGGQGLWMQTSAVNAADFIGNHFGSAASQITVDGVTWYLTSTGAGFLETFSHYQNTPFDTLSHPNGSQCVNNTEGEIYAYLICPLGFAGELPSSSSSEEEPSSSSGEPEQSSSGSEIDLCVEFPGLPICGGTNGSSDSGSGSGGTCADLSNCDWAKLEVQLTQLGVEVAIRDKINDIAGLLQNGYNIEGEQLGALNGIIGAINSGAGNIIGAINGLADGLGAGAGGGNGGIAGGVADGLGQFTSDTTGQGGLDSLLGSFDFGSGGGEMVDSLGSGAGIRDRIKASVGIDSASFAFLGAGGDCPIFKTSFDAGIMGIRSDKDINLCSVYGFNAASVLRAMMWLIVTVSCLFMNLHTIKTGGRG